MTERFIKSAFYTSIIVGSVMALDCIIGIVTQGQYINFDKVNQTISNEAFLLAIQGFATVLFVSFFIISIIFFVRAKYRAVYWLLTIASLGVFIHTPIMLVIVGGGKASAIYIEIEEELKNKAYWVAISIIPLVLYAISVVIFYKTAFKNVK